MTVYEQELKTILEKASVPYPADADEDLLVKMVAEVKANEIALETPDCFGKEEPDPKECSECALYKKCTETVEATRKDAQDLLDLEAEAKKTLKETENKSSKKEAAKAKKASKKTTPDPGTVDPPPTDPPVVKATIASSRAKASTYKVAAFKTVDGKLVFFPEFKDGEDETELLVFRKGNSVKVNSPRSKFHDKVLEIAAYAEKYDCVRCKVEGLAHTADFAASQLTVV